MEYNSREIYNEFFTKDSIHWFRKKNCLIEDYSDLPCPRCGKLKMKKNSILNKKSILNGMAICLECSEEELIRKRLNLEDNVKDWQINCHGEK